MQSNLSITVTLVVLLLFFARPSSVLAEPGSSFSSSSRSKEPKPILSDGFFLGGPISAAEISRDFSKIVIAEMRLFGIDLHSIENGERLASLDGFGKDVVVNGLRFSDNGKRIAASAFHGNAVKLYDDKGMKIKELAVPEGKAGIASLSNFFLKDSKIAAGLGDGSVVAWDVESGNVVREMSFGSGPLLTLAIDEDGRQMFFNLETDKAIGVSDLAAWTSNNEEQQHHATFTKLNWDRECEMPRNGRIFRTWYIVGCEDKTARLYDAQSRELRRVFDRELPGLTFTFNHDGDRLVIGGFDATTEVWDLKTMTLVDSLGFLNIRYPILAVGIAPNSSVVAVAAKNRVKHWTLRGTETSTTKKTTEECGEVEKDKTECKAN